MEITNDDLNLAKEIVKRSKKAKHYNGSFNNLLNNLAKQELAYKKSVDDVGFVSQKANNLVDKILYIKLLSKFIDNIGGLKEYKDIIMEIYIKEAFSSKTVKTEDLLNRIYEGLPK